jgi:hypothetical protein
MALIKDGTYLTKSTSTEFDDIFNPGQEPLFDGIYKCRFCGLEIACKANEPLPDHEHEPKWSTEWYLIVAAYHPNKLIRPFGKRGG